MPAQVNTIPSPTDIKAKMQLARKNGNADAEPLMAPYKQHLAIKEQPREDWEGNVSWLTTSRVAGYALRGLSTGLYAHLLHPAWR